MLLTNLTVDLAKFTFSFCLKESFFGVKQQLYKLTSF